MIFVTGGAGFIGSNFILKWIEKFNTPVVNLDKLTYAGNLHNLTTLENNPLHTFIHGDICDRHLLKKIFNDYAPVSLINFAAESHVDRSIYSPESFITTNIVGTSLLLEEALLYWKDLPQSKKENFRFLQISTDEVYGSISENSPPVSEGACYSPNSPYAASKASADHLVRAYFKTYNLPVMITNSVNNFGPRQFPEKLIPLILLNALNEKQLPIYGDGLHKRDWLSVEDHCDALKLVLEHGKAGESYHIAADNPKTNLSIVHEICHLLDVLKPRANGRSYSELIQFIEDRPGHDRRYALNSSKIRTQLDWNTSASFETHLQKTIDWYLQNPQWIKEVQNGNYRDWIKSHYKREDVC